jgi:hypothetical protein
MTVFRVVVLHGLVEVTEVLAASIIRTYSTDDGGSKYL